MKNNLQKKIFYSFISGIIFGILLNNISESFTQIFDLTINIIKFGGEIFLKIIKMLVVPIVFFSITCWSCELK